MQTARERNPEAWQNWQALIQDANRWTDAHIPRTSSPVRFVPRVVAPFGLRWGMVNKWALVSPSRIAS